MTRREKAAKAREMHEQGLLQKQIAPLLGVSRTYVSELLLDPDGSGVRARKARYGRSCERCGRRTSGSDGRGKAPRVCLVCLRAENTERNASILEWWNEGATLPEIADLLGLEPAVVRGVIAYARETGKQVVLHRLRNRSAWQDIERLWKAGYTQPEIAEQVGTSAAAVGAMAQTMRAVGIQLPTVIRNGSWPRRRELVRLSGLLEVRRERLRLLLLLRGLNGPGR